MSHRATSHIYNIHTYYIYIIYIHIRTYDMCMHICIYVVKLYTFIGLGSRAAVVHFLIVFIYIRTFSGNPGIIGAD